MEKQIYFSKFSFGARSHERTKILISLSIPSKRYKKKILNFPYFIYVYIHPYIIPTWTLPTFAGEGRYLFIVDINCKNEMDVFTNIGIFLHLT